MRIAVMGAGGIGGYVGAQLAAAGEDVVEPDDVGPRERTVRMVEPEQQARVDVLDRADTLAHGESGLVDDLAHDPAEHEARRVADPLADHPQGAEEPLGGLDGSR